MGIINKNRVEGFKERVKKIANDLKLPEDQKKCLLELLEIEMKHPTFENDFVNRYLSIISAEGGLDI